MDLMNWEANEGARLGAGDWDGCWSDYLHLP